MAASEGQPRWTRPASVRRHVKKVENSAISPWAKFNNPVVRKIRTRANATEA